MLIIEAIGLRRSFDGSVDAVRGIDLAVPEGRVFGFLGPNGAGKTTTVRVLCTLLRPSGGTARIAGIDLVRSPYEVRRKIGVALQEMALDPLQSGRELLELQCGLYGMKGRQAKDRAAEMLALVGLEDAADRKVGTYSGGMKRRLDLATALVHRPAVLFLDEPTTGLDPASRLTIWNEVRTASRAGTTIFLTTQYMEEADRLCDELAIIDNGEIVATGTPSSMKAKMGRDVVTISCDGTPAADIRRAVADLPGLERIAEDAGSLALYAEEGASMLSEVVRRLDRAGLGAGSISVARPSLDDVFLSSTGHRLEGAAEGHVPIDPTGAPVG